MEDNRFKHIKTDPKFRRIPKGTQKVKIDKRFRSMFNDKKFHVKYTVDKRGRPVSHNTTEDLKRYYDLSSDDENDLNETDSKDKSLTNETKKKLQNLNVDYARGEGNLLSESSSDDDDDDEEENDDKKSDIDDKIEHKWGELDNDAEPTEKATNRLAACNMDWDRIRAVDLMVLLSSFLPPGGALKSVTIYPSEFGKARLHEEEIRGPIELVELKQVEEDTEEGAKYHMEKLRQYQLNRLKYYYAVIVCDSATSANKIYTECDGMEYESSATKIDLRFIPDDMTFDETPKESCDKLPEVTKYQPRFFTTTALQQAKVDLTWDETDPNRIEVTRKINAGVLDDNDLKDYIAFSDEESEEEPIEQPEETNENPIDKYKQLLHEIENKEEEKKKGEIEMEVSWGVGLKSRTEELVKKKMEEKTPFQQYLDKRKEKRKEKKAKRKDESDDSEIDMDDPYFAEEFDNDEFKTKPKKRKVEEEEENDNNEELELLLNDDDDGGKAHFSLKKIQKHEEDTSKKQQKKKKNRPEKEFIDDFKINVNDERFSAIFSSHHYNIDPTSPHYKKTKAMDTIITEKIKRRTDEDKSPTVTGKNTELNMLIKTVKRKSQIFKNKKL